MPKQIPEKQTKPTVIHWKEADYQSVKRSADVTGRPFAEYVRSAALGRNVNAGRSFPTSEQRQMAIALGALNDHGAALQRMAELMELVGRTDTILARQIETALSKVQIAAEAIMKALGGA